MFLLEQKILFSPHNKIYFILEISLHSASPTVPSSWTLTEKYVGNVGLVRQVRCHPLQIISLPSHLLSKDRAEAQVFPTHDTLA